MPHIESLGKEHLAQVYQIWAQEYEDKDEHFRVLAHDTEKFPGQLGVSVDGDPQSAAVIDSIAAIVQPRYSELTERLREQEKVNGEVSRVGEILAGGNNLVLTTNHYDVRDIAITHAAFYSELDKLGYHTKTGIIISKMIAYLGYILREQPVQDDVPAPAVEILKILQDKIFLSHPQTDSARGRGINRLTSIEVKLHNRVLKRELKAFLGRGAVLLAMAPSGSTDKSLPDGDPNTITMAKMSQGTAEILKMPRTYNLPIAINYKSPEVIFDVCDIPRIMKNEADAHRSMGLIADTLSQRVPNKNFIYNYS
jgi:hypothetical protein